MPDRVRPAARGRAWPPIRALLPLAAVIAVAGCAATGPAEAPPAAGPRVFGTYPTTRRIEQTDRYHDVAVADPFRWLEALESPEVHDWVAAENALAGPYLEALPARALFKERLTAMWDYERWGASLTGGVTTVGIVLGILVIVAAFVLTGVYVSRANSTYDELTQEIVREAVK